MQQKLKCLIIAISSLGIVSCASVPPEKVDERLRAWQGLHIDQLITYWGLPTKQSQVEDKRYAEWINKSSEPGNASVSIGTGSRSRNSAIGIGLTLFDLGGTDDACSRLVTYSPTGTVTQISWQGTNNYCFEVTPDFQKVMKQQKN
ncbi:hypothetical protein FLL45_10040 [Aliikangiella marina]|uniref:Uncharacterized protein n=1 Tax=Aliikangiella marina TaxID=1712262 RepID=A0A545TDL8_9GAMM|nr:hypothetical protein [Aliikangiella marina]TQV75266.1 hypothetical protein FLL45_10040 [Aliikangiella marina]